MIHMSLSKTAKIPIISFNYNLFVCDLIYTGLYSPVLNTKCMHGKVGLFSYVLKFVYFINKANKKNRVKGNLQSCGFLGIFPYIDDG